ncbi:hypothetical protein BDN70DRAFT_998583, partial [Pholiota conissans]
MSPICCLSLSTPRSLQLAAWGSPAVLPTPGCGATRTWHYRPTALRFALYQKRPSLSPAFPQLSSGSLVDPISTSRTLDGWHSVSMVGLDGLSGCSRVLDSMLCRRPPTSLSAGSSPHSYTSS